MRNDLDSYKTMQNVLNSVFLFYLIFLINFRHEVCFIIFLIIKISLWMFSMCLLAIINRVTILHICAVNPNQIDRNASSIG